MNFLFYLLVMVFVFGILIFIHEFGHFITARLCGVSVKEFAVGMGPTVFSWRSKKYDTKYGIRAFPIGGFVSMEGEDEASESDAAFCNKSVTKRLLIVVAGPLMNLLLGFVLMFAIVFSQNAMYSTTIERFANEAVSDEWLQVDDKIIKIGDTRVHTFNEIAYEIMNKGFEPIDVTVERNGERILLESVEFPTFDESGSTFGDYDFISYKEEANFFTSIKHAWFRSISTVKMVIDSVIGLFSGRFGLDAVSGPVGVAETVGTAAKKGISSFLYIMTVLSINLGVMNMIPFPALDGGRFLFLIIEAIIRRPINKNVEAYINFIGIMILFAFMIFITFKDVLKLIIG